MSEQLQEWVNANEPADDLYYKGGFLGQVTFVRDELAYLVGLGLHWDEIASIATVISTHRSKSVILPVYALSRADLGLSVYLRYNFYDWKLSVVSARPIDADFTGLFKTTGPIEQAYTGNELDSVYFEGFPEDLVFGYFEETDRCKWSAAIGSQTAVWTTLFLLMRSLGAVKRREWHTRESHRAALDADSERRRQKNEDEK